MTKDKPIVFSAAMVEAILADRKTQTRRILPVTKMPRFRTGDVMWVKETFQAVRIFGDPEDFRCAIKIPKSPHFFPGDNYWTPIYKAGRYWDDSLEDRGFPWRPAIHMPRWASRITLEVISVRVERLSEITPADAIAEGFEKCPLDDHASEYLDPKDAFRLYWDFLNTDRGLGWDADPEVEVVEFKRRPEVESK